MITLKSLPYASAAEVSKQIESHLLKQNKRSVKLSTTGKSSVCMYRNGEGLCCAAGCLIGDDEYDKLIKDNKLENNTWSMLVGDKIVPGTHAELIRRYQRIHDNIAPPGWKEAFGAVHLSHYDFDIAVSKLTEKYPTDPDPSSQY